MIINQTNNFMNKHYIQRKGQVIHFQPAFKAKSSAIKATQQIVLNTEKATTFSKKHFNNLFNRLGVLDFKTLLKSYLKVPTLETLRPETIEKNVKNLVKKFEKENLSLRDYANACAKQPALFHQAPKTIEKKVRGLVEIFEREGLTVENYLKACLRQPQLFYQSPKTIKSNVIGVVEKFNNDCLTIEKYLKACLKQPSLFAQHPKTIENNVRSLMKKFKISEELCLKICLKEPQLLHQTPDTIESNVRGVAEIFEEENLTFKKYLKACLRQPSLFYQSPKTIEKNVRDLVKNFENKNLSIEKYIEAALNNPSLFYSSPKTVAEHIRAYIFVEKNKKGFVGEKTFNSILKKNLCYSTSLIYLKNLVEPQIKKQYPEINEIKLSNIKDKLKYLFEQKPDIQFEIKILKDSMAEDFIRVIQEFSEKELKAPNAFIFVQVLFNDLTN